MSTNPSTLARLGAVAPRNMAAPAVAVNAASAGRAPPSTRDFDVAGSGNLAMYDNRPTPNIRRKYMKNDDYYSSCFDIVPHFK